MADQTELARYLEEFNLDYQCTEEQRDKSNEELRFAMVPGGQWEGFLEDNFTDRAKIELDQVSDFLFRTYGQWQDNRIAVNYAPDDDVSTDEDAELLDGLFRRDLRRRNGQQAVDAGVFETMACGYGAFHLSTEYEDDEDPDSDDQCVVFTDLPNAYSNVIWDSAARRLDKSDAMRCTVLIPYTRDGFKRKYPDATPDGSLTPQDRRWFNWTMPDLVYVGQRYEVRIESAVVYTWGHPESGDIVKLSQEEQKDDADELRSMGYLELGKKRIRRRNVYVTKFCGGEILEEERRIAGKYIPIIPMYAYFAHIDGVDYWHGLVRKRIDGQRLLNMSASLMAEAAAHSSEDKPIIDPDQIEGLSEHWSQNRHQKPYLPLRALRDENGQIIQAGISGMLPGSTQAATAQTLLQTVNELITRGTGGAPQDTVDTQASGKAINAVLKRVDLNTATVFDNIASAMLHCGEVYRCIAAEIYAERTRQVRIVTKTGEMQPRTLLQVQGKNGQISYANDVSKGKFQVVTDTGPSYQTQAEETIVALKDILAALPQGDQLQRLIVGKIIQLLPSQGLDDIKAFIRKQLLLAGIQQPETQEDVMFLQQASEQGNQPGPQDALIAAAAQNQQAEAAKRMAETEEISSKIIKNQAAAALDVAKARQTVVDIRRGV